ncbi:hypothetical protein L0665_04690 [Methanogenium marinum]|uniref:Uncharacterized protein n=1 Tax=Methanogenium marinum TaxID=348610 RepID=A0A9Q4KV12_9EURY|nr:hypothetical protein [Methanogenium marinum]MDE4907905.1 hypothetical protein [Methanogenium marinum]
MKIPNIIIIRISFLEEKPLIPHYTDERYSCFGNGLTPGTWNIMTENSYHFMYGRKFSTQLNTNYVSLESPFMGIP